MNTSHRLCALSIAVLSLASFVTGCSSSGSNGTGGSSGGSPGGANEPGGSRFFLPTGQPDNTSAPSVEVDAAGNTHSVYPAYAHGGAYYAYCGAGCTGSDSTQVVKLETEGTVTNAMLALDPQGHPRILLSAYRNVYYAQCDADCGNQASWSIAPIIDRCAGPPSSCRADPRRRGGRAAARARSARRR